MTCDWCCQLIEDTVQIATRWTLTATPEESLLSGVWHGPCFVEFIAYKDLQTKGPACATSPGGDG